MRVESETKCLGVVGALSASALWRAWRLFSQGGGPWGHRGDGSDDGSGGGRQPPPNLEDMIRRGQDRMRDIFGGGAGSGGGSSGGGLFPGGRGSRTLTAGLILAGAAALWISQCLYVVSPEEEGVVLRFGAYNRTTPPGLHFVFWPVETVETPKTQEENQINLGRAPGRSRGGVEGLMLGGDQNVVDIGFTVLWKVGDPRKFLFNIRDQEQLVHVIAESAMREVVGQTSAEVIRTRGREEAQDSVRDLIQATLDSYDAGIVITGVKLEAADPPPSVLDAFEEVQRAEQNQDKFIRDAQQYRNKRLGEARGESSMILQEAKAYEAQVVNEAKGQASRFDSVLDEYLKAPDVTRKRLFIETFEKVLADSSKVIIEQDGGQGVLPYLPLPELRGGSGRGGQ